MDAYASHLRHHEQARPMDIGTPGNTRRTLLPYHDHIERDNAGHFLTPPSDARLSDALVFLVIATGVPVRQRRVRWPVDFTSDGDIKPNRWPMGDPVVIDNAFRNFLRGYFSIATTGLPAREPSLSGSSAYSTPDD
ncbi:hypothetical protein N7519_004480 [Penicillium mononematosum]|uniref:uncharacterized protein n=1 Tax=Penicillium mononematosum TaxID=268346 RepID=UPI002548E6B5|nr:uncharacterized protein N7519_004480 [Penicillium mononematosum]KAJ6189572.1 hypothetical protein N7519_004480 [Penicillium mononematosum]